MKALRMKLGRVDYEGRESKGIVELTVVGSGEHGRFIVSFGPPGLASVKNCAYVRNFLKRAIKRLEKKKR